MNGVFAVKKPCGPTSQDCVGKLKHLFTNSSHFQPDKNKKRRNQFIKIGHGGTLDPLADGVLVIGVGAGTKQLQKYLGSCQKTYTATCLFGCSTTTYDSEGSVLEWSNLDTLNNEKIQAALTKFSGKISQIPPVFSAIKMDGLPFYEYARKGLKLPRAIDARECDISHISASELRWEHSYEFPKTSATEEEREFAKNPVQSTSESVPKDEPKSNGEAPTALTRGPVIDINFTVSSGTYIRSLIHDLCRELGVHGHMVKLTRTIQAEWELDRNVIPMQIFDAKDERWWPLLEDVLVKGPKRLVLDMDLELNVDSS